MSKIDIELLDLESAIKLGIDNWSEWGCEVSKFDWYYDKSETCYILEGDVLVITDHEKVHIRDGMLVTFPEGLKCIWDVRKPIKKKYIFND
ncbi:MAG: DUF861 domain-containing protein [Clostridiales bacterium]|nr:DUF861 domain-containing protein [Clostridiales bacterium]